MRTGTEKCFQAWSHHLDKLMSLDVQMSNREREAAELEILKNEPLVERIAISLAYAYGEKYPDMEPNDWRQDAKGIMVLVSYPVSGQ